ncbi:MAG: hypothetical protein ABJB34_01450 [Acidobacteriota bacterium]
MVTSMTHEAFYESGAWSAPDLGISAGWVADRDSFAAGQLFCNVEKDVVIIFSGECYVDAPLPADFKEKGHTSKNPGHWLIHLYEEHGEQFLGELNGLFSGLLVDTRRKRAFLFNDRYGLERIYWHETEGALYFASEAKALLRVLPALREFDAEGVGQFLTWGCTLEDRTLFRGVRLLPGASLWSFESGKSRKRNYFSVEEWESQPILPAESFEVQLEETFKRVLPRYFESELKIGVSLTAGLDSRMIMACRPNNGANPICYTFSGEKGLTLDDRLAASVAQSCGLDYRLLRIESDFFSNFGEHADRTVYLTDGCFGLLGAHEIYLNKKARELAPVRVTGNYGSEVLRGVSTFKPTALSPKLLNPKFDGYAASSRPAIVHGTTHPVTFAAFREVPWKHFGSLAAGRSQTVFRSPYLDNEIVALAYRMPRQLRSSPRTAVQIVRKNDPVIGTIPTDMGLLGNPLLLVNLPRRIFSKITFKLDYFNNEGLPARFSLLDSSFRRLTLRTRVLGLHKFLHYRSWFQCELQSYLRHRIADASARQSPFWSADFVRSMVIEHASGHKNYIREINAVLTLDAVERLFFGNFDSQD